MTASDHQLERSVLNLVHSLRSRSVKPGRWVGRTGFAYASVALDMTWFPSFIADFWFHGGPGSKWPTRYRAAYSTVFPVSRMKASSRSAGRATGGVAA